LTGTIIDAETEAPVPFAYIVVAGTRHGASADIDGKFVIAIASPAKLVASSVGYSKQIVEVTGGNTIIRLKKETIELREVVVNPGENPAHVIVRKVRAHRQENDPEQLGSYIFRSYNKLYITFSQDAPAFEKSKALRAKMDSSELFVSESVVAHKFKNPGRTHELVIAHKTSGVASPIFASMLTDFQPISFYRNWFFMNATEKNYLNPLFDQHFEKYDLELLDTLYTELDSTFVISFQPYRGTNFDALKGVVFINSNGYAIENVMAESCNKTDGFGFTIQQKYTYTNGHWFPCQLNTDLVVQDRKNVIYGARYIHKSYLQDLEINAGLGNDDFPAMTRELASDVSKKPLEFWERNRVTGLSLKESATYTHFEQNPNVPLNTMMNVTESILSGSIRTSKFDFPFSQLMAYNEYEGLRPGLGVRTNDGISKTMRYGGYLAFGLKDRSLKFGGDVEVRFLNPAYTTLRFLYQQDVSEPGVTIDATQEERLFLKEGYRGLLSSRMDSLQLFGTSVSTYLHPHLNLSVNVSHEMRKPLYPYEFAGLESSPGVFNSTETSLSLRYARGEKRMTMGTAVLTTTFPTTILELEISKGVPMQKGELDYLKVHSSAAFRINTKHFGSTSVHAAGGYIYGNLPYSYLFNGRGTSQSLAFLYLPNTFQTMGIYEFLSDRYASLFVTQNFGNLLLKSTKVQSTPELMLTHGAYWGQLSNSSRHNEITYKIPAQGYFEGGAIVNKLWRIRYLNICFIDVGVGAFFRYGPEAHPGLKDNFTFKLMVGASF
jgi:hypothetical protein